MRSVVVYKRRVRRTEQHMIPDIGLMIAAYIVTRIAALLGQPIPQANVGAKVLGVITIIVTVICTVDLLSHSVNVPPAMR